MPHSNYDSQELAPELLYEPQELASSQLLPPPMPELSQIKTGRSPQFATSTTSESGSHRSPVVEVHTTQDLPEEQPTEQHEEHRPSQASLFRGCIQSFSWKCTTGLASFSKPRKTQRGGWEVGVARHVKMSSSITHNLGLLEKLYSRMSSAGRKSLRGMGICYTSCGCNLPEVTDRAMSSYQKKEGCLQLFFLRAM